jgi:hypothetical protein
MWVRVDLLNECVVAVDSACRGCRRPWGSERRAAEAEVNPVLPEAEVDSAVRGGIYRCLSAQRHGLRTHVLSGA